MPPKSDKKVFVYFCFFGKIKINSFKFVFINFFLQQKDLYFLKIKIR